MEKAQTRTGNTPTAIDNLRAAYELLTTTCIRMSEARQVDADAEQVFEARRQLATALEALGALA